MGSYTHKLMQRGVTLHQSGNLADAQSAYRQVLSLEPRHPDALHLLGVALHQSGKTPEGIDLVKQAIQLRPQAPEYWVNAGELLRSAGRLEESLSHFQTAARLNPSIPELHNNLATLHGEMNHLPLAESSLQKALSLRPNYPEAWVNWGNLQDRKGKWPDALDSYHKALSLDPNSAPALASMGNVLGKMGRTEEALQALLRAVQLNPRVSKARNNLANILQSRGLLSESLTEYRAAIQLDPRNIVAWSNLLFALNRDPSLTPQEIFEAHRAFGQQFETPREGHQPPVLGGTDIPVPDEPPEPSVFGGTDIPVCDEPQARSSPPQSKPRLRIGLVSPDLRKHSVASFLEPILTHYDRARLHITCYSNTVLTDPVTDRLKSLADAWTDVTGMTDAEMDRQIRSDSIDILIDLAGHTEGNRLTLFTRRPAPVQATYLGYPNTTGLRSIQYRLTDPVADPPGLTDPFHTETLLRLPHTAWCYLPPANAPDITPRPPGPITFGSFNNLAKVSPPLIALWSSLLKRVPDSRILLKSRSLDDPATRDFIHRLFESHAIDRTRVDLLSWDPSATSHLATYTRIDIALDTYPYHGTTTTCESLLMGIPVITLAGQTHVSRVGASLLNTVGLPELIAKNQDEYLAIAEQLARDDAKLADLRKTLRANLLASPLCNAPAFARDFESALHTMWQKQQGGEGSPA